GCHNGPRLTQARIAAGHLLCHGQGLVALRILAQMVVRMRGGQARQDLALVGTRPGHHAREVLVGVYITPFEDIDPAAFQGLLVAPDRAASTPASKALRKRTNPEKYQKKEIQKCEPANEKEDRENERKLDAPRLRDDDDVAAMLAQQQRHRDSGDEQDDSPEPGTHASTSVPAVCSGSVVR